MKFLSGIILLSFAATPVLKGQTAAPQPQLQLNTIFAGADGKFEAAPDTAVVRMDLASQQDSSRAAYSRVAAAVDRVRQVLRSNGIDPKNAQFSMYQLQPMYDWKDPKHRVIGYRASSDVTLKLRDLAKAGDLLEQLANIEDTQNQSVSYILEDIEQAKAKAAEDALKKARTEASAIATAGGRSLGELLYASVDVSQPSIIPVMAPHRMAMAAASAAPAPTAEFTPQTVTVNAHVNALFALK